MRSLKPHFLETAKHYRELGEYGEQYAALLTFAAIEPTSIFSRQELSLATGILPIGGLKRALQTLAQALEGAGEQRKDYWISRIVPYLKRIWPKSRENLSQDISQTFARICVAAEDSFPEAFQEVRAWLLPLDDLHYVIHLLQGKGLCTKFPADALAFLDVIVPGNLRWQPTHLRQCLTQISAAQPTLKEDRRYLRLQSLIQ
jgi:hypothetical protein